MNPLPIPFRQAGLVVLALGIFVTAGWAQTAPTITTQPPPTLFVDADQDISLSVVAAGSAPLSYQWLKDFSPIAGATSATLTISRAQVFTDWGNYCVVVSNPAGSVTSNLCILSVNHAPFFYQQPETQGMLAGGSVTFQSGGLGWPIPTMQWSKDGVAIPGATGTTLTLANVTPASAGSYTLTLSNRLGTVTSQPALLSVGTGLVIVTEPAGAHIQSGESATFVVGVTGTMLACRWQQQQQGFGSPWSDLADQGIYSGTATRTLHLANPPMALNDARYRCVVTNSAGTETSAAATLTIEGFPPFSGAYFGSFDSGGGHWAISLNGTSATFLAYLPDRHSVIVQSLYIPASGEFSTTAVERLAGNVTGAGATITLSGQITGTAAAPSVRTVTGTIPAFGKTFSGEFRAGNGALTPASGDFYSALALNGDQGAVYTVVGYGGDVLAVVISPTAADGVLGQLALTTPITAATTVATANGAMLGLTVNIISHSLAATYVPASSGARTVSFLGLGAATATTSKLAGLSIRGLAGQGDQTLIVGYVVSGAAAKPVLVRAVGPSLIPQGVSGVLANPRLRIFSATGALLSENEDWGGGAPLQAMFQSLGAFALTSPLDAALATSLPDGVYTAHAGSTAGANGVALLEAYDADTSRTTRLVALSARALAGTGDNTLIAGFVITGNAPVTLLIRGVGPTLANYGVTGPLADPQLKVFDASGQVLAQNDNWGGGADLQAQFAALGAAPLTSPLDAALRITLPPGVYTAQVSSTDGRTGVALVEVYEVP